ncbi:MAG: ATP-binding protein [Sphingorhabdus sp.]|uniref:hypothetical protein n=1 Tax=Sphingorhabdus sp. TaxID=1902408 RepID=UPI003CC18C4C
MHPGGIADKVGNRYEAIWLIRQLVQLIDGRVMAITIEALGAEGAGFEFAVDRPTLREWHQCKRQTSGSWTINRLAGEGVLTNFKTKVANSSGDTCVFVSTDPTKQIKLLKEKWPAARDVEQFEASLSAEEQTHWQNLQQQLDLGADHSLEWLARCEFLTFPEAELTSSVLAELERWFGSSSVDVLAALRTWVEEDRNFNRPITRADLEAFVTERDIVLKQYEFDRTIPGKLKAANLNYDESYRPIGAGLFDIERAEVDSLVSAFSDAHAPRMVALAGPAGSGKSAIIRKALGRFDVGTIPILVFRVDHLAGVSSLSGLGETTIDIDDSPAVVLQQLAGHQEAILIIDQADAVSDMSGRASAVRTVLLKLLRQARHYRQLKVVFSCRSFDLENDHEFRAITDPDHCTRIDVAPLRWTEDVLPVAVRLGIGVKQAGPKVQALLCQPIGLAIAAELARTGPVDLGHVEHISQLYDKLLELRDRELRSLHQPGWGLYDALGSIARSMSEREQLAAPVSVLDRFPGATDLLQQAGLVVASGRKLALMHESLFDHLHAREFVAQGNRLQDFLLESEQTLFRRTQVRQILAQERDLDRNGYLSDLEFILSDRCVRPHIRDLVIKWLATIADPGIDEWNLVLASGEGGEGLPRHTGRVIFGNKGWILLLETQGILDTWLEADNDDDLFWILRAVEGTAKASEPDAVRLLMRFLDRRPDKAALLLRCFTWFQPEREMPEIADVVIRSLSLSDVMAFEDMGEGPFSVADGWVKHAPVNAGRILAAVLDNWYRHHDAGTPFGDEAHHVHRDFHHFHELVELDPVAALTSVLPAMRVAMDRTEIGDERPSEDRLWHWRRKDRGPGPHSVEFIDMVRSALHKVAENEPDRISDLLAPLDPRRHMTALHLTLEAISANPALATLLEEQADNPGLFKAGWHHANAFSAGKATATTWHMLRPEVREQLEVRLMSLYPELVFAARCARKSKQPAKEGDWPPEQLKLWARHALADSGKTQWSTFRQLTNIEMSPKAQRRALELERKFKGQEPEEPEGIRSGSSRSPIAPDRAKRMSDEDWLSAIGTDWSSRRQRSGIDFVGDAGDLARVLQEEAKADPERFLALYWKLPRDAPPVLARGILHAVAEGRFDTDALDALLAGLEEDSPWQVDEHTLLWLITQRNGGALGPKAMAVLRQLAVDGDVGKEREATRKDNEKPEPQFRVAMRVGHELAWRGRETARGKAIDLLGRRAWHDKSLFEHDRVLVDRVIGDLGPERLLAATSIFVEAAIKHSTPDAARWLGHMLELAPLSIASDGGRAALQHLDQLDHDAARPILLALLHGDDGPLSALAAALIFVRSWDEQRWALERELILNGCEEWRAAAAHVAANQVDRDSFDPMLNALIVNFFNDNSELVRTAAADVFRNLDTGAMAIHAELYRGYLNSKWFEGERTYFMHRLEDAPAALDSLVLELIELVAAKVSAATAGRGTIGYRLWEPLMRIYTSNEGDAAIRKRCLDVIDVLVVSDIGGSDKLQEATR